MECC